MDSKKLAHSIDHTLLKPDATPDMIEQLCREADQYGFYAVCVNPVYVKQAAGLLAESTVKICTVIGFPLGASCAVLKAEEAELAASQGADEIDMVIAIGLVKAGLKAQVRADITEVVKAAGDRLVKVILETCLLSDDEKTMACRQAVLAGAQFVKTSTGFSTAGATLDDVRLMRRIVGPEIGVKASGGIRDYDAAVGMLEAGANRLGTSAGIAIVTSAPD